MRFKLVACEVLAREVYLSAARSPHLVDLELVEKGLHNTPDILRVELQERVDAAEPGRYDAILLGYGLCGNALLGLTARDVPVVVPRAHDCITLYLGSRATYNAKFAENSGTYYYTADYIERTSSDQDSLAVSLGTAITTDIQAVYETYVEKYGKDNADYLMEVMGEWSAHYSRAVYIDHEETRFLGCEQLAIDEAKSPWVEVRERAGQPAAVPPVDVGRVAGGGLPGRGAGPQDSAVLRRRRHRCCLGSDRDPAAKGCWSV